MAAGGAAVRALVLAGGAAARALVLAAGTAARALVLAARPRAPGERARAEASAAAVVNPAAAEVSRGLGARFLDQAVRREPAVKPESGGGGGQGGGQGGGKGGTSPGSAGRAGTGGAPSGSGGAASGGAGGAAGCDEAHGYHLPPQGDTCTNAPRVLGIFDYDLVLSSHSCAQTMSKPTEYLCRTNDCTTYAWHDQCLATAAHTAIAECVRHGAYVGIASHSQFDACFNDKVIETLTPAAFPEFFSSIHYNKTGTDFSYPAIDNRANWNCDTCAYHFDGMTKGSKAALIRKVMAHYGLSPTSKADQSRVVYWEDDPAFIDDVHTNLPNAQVIAVASTNPASNGAGCGIQAANVTAGWSALAASAP